MMQVVEKTELGLLPRLLAAGWFAGAACIPIIFFFVVIRRVLFFGAAFDASDPLIAVTFIVLPITMAAFFGFLIGSRILDGRSVRRGWSGVIHGGLVAILSYFGFMMAYAVIVAASASRSLSEAIGFAFFLFFIGTALVGWLIVLAGSLSGWMLFRFSPKWVGARRARRNKKNAPLRMNLGAAAALLVILFVCWWPFRKEAQRENSEAAKRDLIQAVWQNDPARVNELLASGLSVDTADAGGSTLLLTAAEKGETRIVKMLLDQGANPNVTTESYGHRPPLHWAAQNFVVESIKALLDHGANINTSDDFGRTALMQAASTTDRDTVGLLIQRGANVNYRSQDGSTALSLARRDRDVAGNFDRPDAPGERLDAGQNYGDSRDYQNPATIKRARARHDAIIELLVSYGAK